MGSLVLIDQRPAGVIRPLSLSEYSAECIMETREMRFTPQELRVLQQHRQITTIDYRQIFLRCAALLSQQCVKIRSRVALCLY